MPSEQPSRTPIERCEVVAHGASSTRKDPAEQQAATLRHERPRVAVNRWRNSVENGVCRSGASRIDVKERKAFALVLRRYAGHIHGRRVGREEARSDGAPRSGPPGCEIDGSQTRGASTAAVGGHIGG